MVHTDITDLRCMLSQVRFLDPGGQHVTVTKPFIHELDLHHSDRRQMCPDLDAIFNHAHELAAHVNDLVCVAHR